MRNNDKQQYWHKHIMEWSKSGESDTDVASSLQESMVDLDHNKYILPKALYHYKFLQPANVYLSGIRKDT